MHTDFHGQHVVVLGFAREGESLTRFLTEHGATVTITDSAPAERLADQISEIGPRVRLVTGPDRTSALDSAEIVFVSPGVPHSDPVYRRAVEQRVPIQSMTTLFFDLCPAPIVGITGSSGKTTTTSLLGHIVRRAGMDAVVGGNIGDPMLDLLPRIRSTSVVILELSSFQLELLRVSPHIAVVTNISANHLDRHGDMAEYVAAKRHNVEHQSADDIAVLNGRDDAMAEFAHSTPAHIVWFGGDYCVGAGVEHDCVVLRRGDISEPVLRVKQIPLLGRHNVENVLAACTVADCLGIDATVMAEAILDYQPPAHRLERVGPPGSVRYVDDSIATTPDRSMVAMRAIDSPLILIAGGRDKSLPWDRWAEMVAQRVRVLILIGEAADLIAEAVRKEIDRAPASRKLETIQRCDSVDAAVQCAQSRAEAGDTVLLSPGCASYDMFTDFHERGIAFARAAENVNAA